MKKKRAMTLLEIMIVILIIGIIGSVVGYNMRGALTEGKAFKSQEGIRQLYDIFQLELAQGTSLSDIQDNPEKILRNTGLVRKPEELLKDGWKVPYNIVQTPERDDLRITSKRYAKHREDHGKEPIYPWEEEKTETSQ